MSLPVGCPPILFLIFNRPDITSAVFDVIRYAKPGKLFIAADGPRSNKEEDLLLCAETRRVVEKVDWDCEVNTLFRESNLGCKAAVRESIGWFFENVDEGIILEDDCRPAGSFFDFAGNMLAKYRDEQNVKLISGTNHLFGAFDRRNGYFFSHTMPIWGWATWKRAWQEVAFFDNGSEADVNETKLMSYYHGHQKYAGWIREMLTNTFFNDLNAWSPYMLHKYIASDGLTIIPFRNLVSNIGESGTHEEDQGVSFLNRPVKDLDINNLLHPQSVQVDLEMDRISMDNIMDVLYGKTTVLSKVNFKLKKWLKRVKKR